MKRLALLLAVSLVACGGSEDGGDSAAQGPSVPVAGRDGALKTTPLERAKRRAYDGAPPVIPHQPMGMNCIACHNERGMDVADVGFAPPSPHERTEGLSALSRCEQCHVFRTTDAKFVANTFAGLPQDLRPGARAYDGAPPVLPHGLLMHENCLACHSGPAAREEIRTTHPERENCVQCHVVQDEATTFSR